MEAKKDALLTASQELKNHLAIEIFDFHVTTFESSIRIDISIESAHLSFEIFNICVWMEKTEIHMQFPEDYDPFHFRNIPCIKFPNRETLKFIEDEIEKTIRSLSWLMKFFEENDIEAY